MSETTMGRRQKGRVNEGQFVSLGKFIHQTAPLETCMSIKLRLIELIKHSNSWLNDNNDIVHVSGDWEKEMIYRVSRLPFATVKLDEIPDQLIYGRRVPNAGTNVVYEFTIHLLHSACSESGESRQRYVHQIADDVYDVMDSRRRQESPYGVSDIYDLTIREVPLRKTFGLVKMEIRGKLLGKRDDS